MPETRYITEYQYPKDLPASEKTVANAKANHWIKKIPYEVSDEELEREQAQRDIDEFIQKPDDTLTAKDIAKFLKAKEKVG